MIHNRRDLLKLLGILPVAGAMPCLDRATAKLLRRPKPIPPHRVSAPTLIMHSRVFGGFLKTDLLRNHYQDGLNSPTLLDFPLLLSDRFTTPAFLRELDSFLMFNTGISITPMPHRIPVCRANAELLYVLVLHPFTETHVSKVKQLLATCGLDTMPNEGVTLL